MEKVGNHTDRAEPHSEWSSRGGGRDREGREREREIEVNERERGVSESEREREIKGWIMERERVGQRATVIVGIGERELQRQDGWIERG